MRDDWKRASQLLLATSCGKLVQLQLHSTNFRVFHFVPSSVIDPFHGFVSFLRCNLAWSRGIFRGIEHGIREKGEEILETQSQGSLAILRGRVLCPEWMSTFQLGVTAPVRKYRTDIVEIPRFKLSYPRSFAEKSNSCSRALITHRFPPKSFRFGNERNRKEKENQLDHCGRKCFNFLSFVEILNSENKKIIWQGSTIDFCPFEI